MMQSQVPPRQYQMVSSSKAIRCVCFNPQHLKQTAEPTHAALAVGKRRSFLSRNLRNLRVQSEKKKEPACFPNTVFVMTRKCMCIWGLWWLFHAEGLMFQRLTHGTKCGTCERQWSCKHSELSSLRSLSSSCPVNLQFCLWLPLLLHWASGSLACSPNHRSFLWVNWNHGMELEAHFTSLLL